MLPSERVAIVKALAASHMWGQDGVASVFLGRLDKALPSESSWGLLYSEHAKAAQRECMGVLDDEERLNNYLTRGYWLTNYDEDGCSLFNPPPMNGLATYVSKRLAEQHPKRW